MADVSTLYNIQPVIEAAAIAVLSASAGITNVYPSREDNNERPTPRVEVQCVVGNPNGHVYLSSSREWFYDQFEVQLNALVTTDRAFGEVSHSAYVSKVRSVLCNNTLFNTASLLPNYIMARPQMNGSTYAIDEEKNFDSTAIGTSHIVIIKPASWQ